MQVVQHNMMRNANMLTILNYIRQYGPVSKRQMQMETGISWGGVSNITAELLEKGLIIDFKQNEHTLGRAPSLFDINPNNNLVIGCDINFTGITVVLLDLKCRTLYEKKQDIIDSDKDALLDQVISLIYELLSKTSARKKNLLGIGVSMQGSVDYENGVSLYMPHLHNWSCVPVKSILQQEFDLPVQVRHDSDCSTLAEQWVGCAKHVSNFIFIRLDAGIGMGMVLNDKLFTGSKGMVGELGHTIAEPGGAPCHCGSKGCLEMYASINGILYHASQLPGRNGTPETISQIAEKARNGEKPYLDIFKKAGVYLGNTFTNMVKVIDPDMIVFSGELLAYKDLFWEDMENTIKETSWKYSKAKLVISSVKSHAAIGAALEFVQMAFSGEIPDLLHQPGDL